MYSEPILDRRSFLAGSLASAGSALLAGGAFAQGEASGGNKRPICAFIKFIQELPHEQMAETVARLGFDGIEATVRDGGQILPGEVQEELPTLVEALNRHGIEITIMTTSVTRADDPLSEKVLRTAAALGVKRYRMGYYRYDLSKPVIGQLDGFRPVLKDLAALNRELGLTAVYQNHAGAQYVGASIWDLHRLLEDVSPEEVGYAFDVRHATVEGGMAWPVSWNLVQSQLGAVFAKDFQWMGRRPSNVPLGEGQVDPKFFTMLQRSEFEGPISLHVEYLPKAGLQENVDALGRDLKTLQRLLAGAH